MTLKNTCLSYWSYSRDWHHFFVSLHDHTHEGSCPWSPSLKKGGGCSIAQSCPTLCTLMPISHQASLSFTISWSLLTFMSIELVILSNPSHPLPPSSPFAFSLSQHQSFSVAQLFASGGQSTGASASASILPMNLQGRFPLELTGLSPCSARDPQESSPAPQFKSINSSVLSLLHGPTLTLVQDYWKSHSSDYIDLCQQSDVFAFCHSFPFKKQRSFNFMAAVTICSDFGAQENKICHWFHFFPFYFSWSTGTGCHDLSFFNVEF